jgi:hypothetical protein
MDLPRFFCWTRFGTEAGQPIEQILERKEQERVVNNGLFLWGIGNSLTPSMIELLKRTSKPEVVFSPTKTKARIEDSEPARVVAWTRAETLTGDDFTLPPASLITSGLDSPRKHTHYALVCFQDRPLIRESGCLVDFYALRNILTGQPIGASQVTAIVERSASPGPRARDYDVALRASLVFPFFVKLRKPMLLAESRGQDETWMDIVQLAWARIRSGATIQDKAGQ